MHQVAIRFKVFDLSDGVGLQKIRGRTPVGLNPSHRLGFESSDLWLRQSDRKVISVREQISVAVEEVYLQMDLGIPFPEFRQGG